MKQEQINFILNQLFWDFEQNKFVNDGIWPRQANLIFAFADYVEELKEEDIIPFIPQDAYFNLKEIKTAAIIGINEWLKYNMKTLMM